MSSRAANKPGFGFNRGAVNPKIHVGDTAPSNPKDRDLWFDTTASPGTWKWYDEDTSTWKE